MAEKIDLLLINPGNRVEQFAGLNPLATVAPPLGIASMAGWLIRCGFRVRIIDAEAEGWSPERTLEEVGKYEPLLIGLTAFTTKMTQAGIILKLIKKKYPDIKTAIGGHHPSAIPLRTLEEESADYVVQGEGYYPLMQLLYKLRASDLKMDIQGVWYKDGDRVIEGGRANQIINLDDIPPSAWYLLPMHKYRAHHWQAWEHDLDQSGFAVFNTSLGCPFNCDYCTVNVVYGNNHVRYRSPRKIVAELTHLKRQYGVKYIEIIDDTFTVNRARCENVCRELIRAKLDLRMWCFARADTIDARMASMMREAGIEWVFCGVESGNEETLRGVNKNITIEQVKKAADVIHEAGMHLGCNYIFGLEGDTRESMQSTLDLAKDINSEYANFFVMMAYPGTRLHDIAREKMWPLPERWCQYGFFAPDAVPMRTDKLTAEEIVAFRDNAFKEYFNGEKYQKMILDKFGAKTLAFLNTKVLSKDIKRDVPKKPIKKKKRRVKK